MTTPFPSDVDRLAAAGATGDVAALMQLAVLRMTGRATARDLPEARRLLREAVTIGHVDGALMEIALTANGSGGPADWRAALALLEVAATADPVAAAQRALLAAMKLRKDGAPETAPVGAALSQSPTISLFRGFLTPAECQHVASAASAVMEPSLVADPATGRAIANPVRRCDNAVIGPTREDLVVRAINLRIAAASGTAVEQGESLTVLRYGPGQEFRPHHDGLPGVANQRIKTMLIYLNQGFAGGETRFMANGLTVTPRGGDAILFDNVDASGRIDPRSQHAGLPVTRGVKWLATRWIRAAPLDPWAA
ncbi:2OG-Fe(II) oxygenase [Sphingomonas sp. SUN019]|uniref:2OG-Fe(II) oxygenase n=1 Tax=Sphingomonas sp. SUN019 TaxID=2937788 RepID=UPI0021643263|nr:2OG-Fe(II) oxygenase [Sphingomonas sp. SUN019]UVO52318.1 2OG-Fe(II) oxygenase [Sphingomonas sp. SUN019]